MELISHIGLLPGPAPSAGRVLRKFGAFFSLALLFAFAIAYQIFSFWCHFAAIAWPRRISKLQRTISQFFWAVAIALAQYNKVEIRITGERITADSAVIISNHQSLADHIVLAHLAQSASINSVPRVNFFTWFSLWNIPSIRLMLNMIACDENWELTKSMALALFKKVSLSDIPEWIVVFPEVNIWTPTSAYLQRLQSLKYYLPQYDHLLYPRFSAINSAVTMAKTSGRHKFLNVYDVTISYPQASAPTLARFFCSADPIRVFVHVRISPISSIPSKRSKIEAWLERRWLEKDKRLARMRPGYNKFGTDETHDTNNLNDLNKTGKLGGNANG